MPNVNRDNWPDRRDLMLATVPLPANREVLTRYLAERQSGGIKTATVANDDPPDLSAPSGNVDEAAPEPSRPAPRRQPLAATRAKPAATAPTPHPDAAKARRAGLACVRVAAALPRT